MINATGRLLSSAGIPPQFLNKVNINHIDFTTGQLFDFQYTRNDSVKTYRDENGKLQAAGLNEAPFEYDLDGNALGIPVEGSRTNICEAANYNPTDTTGISVATGSAIVSVVDDSAALAAAGLDGVCTNGQVYRIDNSGGGSFSNVRITGSTASVTDPIVYSYGAYIRYEDNTYHGGMRLSNSGSSLTMQQGKDGNDDATIGSEYRLIKQENYPEKDPRMLEFVVAAGKTIYVILFQLEEGKHLSSIILNSGGGTAKREATRLYDLDLGRYIADTSEGSIALRARAMTDTVYDNYLTIFALNEGTSYTNTLSMRVSSTHAKPQFYAEVDNSPVSSSLFPSNGLVKDQEQVYGFTWKQGEYKVLAGGKELIAEGLDVPNNLNRIDLGSMPGGSNSFFWIQSLTIADKSVPFDQVTMHAFKATDRVYSFAGQSNSEGHFKQNSTLFNDGERALTEQARLYTDENVIFLNGAIPNSAAIKANAGGSDNWWFDPDTGEFGPTYYRWESGIKALLASTANIRAIYWNQGERDAGASAAAIQYATQAIFNQMRSVVGDVPIFIAPMGRREDNSYHAYNDLFLAQEALLSANSWLKKVPETYTYDLDDDNIHMSDDGYSNYAPLLVDFIEDTLGTTVTNPVTPPDISGAEFSTSTTVDVTIIHGDGSDFTPVTDIEGFTFINGSSAEITIISASRIAPDKIRLTLASPQTDGTLYYGYGSMTGLTIANTVQDNSSRNLALRRAIIEL